MSTSPLFRRPDVLSFSTPQWNTLPLRRITLIPINNGGPEESTILFFILLLIYMIFCIFYYPNHHIKTQTKNKKILQNKEKSQRSAAGGVFPNLFTGRIFAVCHHYYHNYFNVPHFPAGFPFGMWKKKKNGPVAFFLFYYFFNTHLPTTVVCTTILLKISSSI